MRLGQAERLNLRAHRPVENEDALPRRLPQGVRRRLLVRESDAEGGVERIIHGRTAAHRIDIST